MGSCTIWTLALHLAGVAPARTHRTPHGQGQGCSTHGQAWQKEGTELSKRNEIMGGKKDQQFHIVKPRKLTKEDLKHRHLLTCKWTESAIS